MEHLLYFLPDNKPKKEVDILLITGDVFIDHPSFGIAIIARVLEANGYSICIASQPEYFNKEYINILPTPKLFVGISSGNLDSVVANYSGNRNTRKEDSYCIDGNGLFANGQKRRPDRATIVYTSFIKQKFKEIPVVLGGLEASIRRFSHYDFVQQKLRKSILVDSKADILVYSMGEKAIVEIAKKIKEKESLLGIKGTVIRCGKIDDQILIQNPLNLPSFSEIEQNKDLLLTATQLIEENMVFDKASILIQNQTDISVVSFPPQPPLTEDEMDFIYSLPFQKDKPDYCERVPAWNMIKDSITVHRGCYGKCSFCAITSHQGSIISKRSKKSVIDEVQKLVKTNFFKGTITDLGGPTANMYGTYCKIGYCKNPNCLYPELCKNLIIDKNIYKNLLCEVKKIEGVKNVFVSSGLRHDLALLKKEETEFIITNCTSGHLKIAPEHINEKVLNLMCKPKNQVFIEFIEFFEEIKKKNHLKFYFLPYIILSFPGSNEESVKELGNFLNKYNIRTYQYQDFTPVPQTMATAMFYCGKDLSGKKINTLSPSVLSNSQREILKKYLTGSK